MLGPINFLVESALFLGGSSPGGAEIPTEREDPVPVVSCFCAGMSRNQRQELNSQRIGHDHVSLYAPY